MKTMYLQIEYHLHGKELNIFGPWKEIENFSVFILTSGI